MFADMDENLDRIADDYKEFHEKGKPVRPQDLMEADAKVATRAFASAALHADCAACLITQFVLGHSPILAPDTSLAATERRRANMSATA